MCADSDSYFYCQEHEGLHRTGDEEEGNMDIGDDGDDEREAMIMTDGTMCPG